MQQANTENIDILGFDDGHRGGVFAPKPVNMDELRDNVKNFLEKFQRIVDDLPEQNEGYQLDTIEIHAVIGLSGKVSLLGFGSEISGSGGIKFVLKKKGASET